MTSHPLEDEDIVCTVTLSHEPTRVTVTQTIVAPADGPPDVTDAVQQATEKAMDVLLQEIEERGGS